jgi:hypothetical protein
MNTLKGIIKDLDDDETHIAGCTTPGEIIITLESMDSRLDNAIEYNKYTTNGELFEKAHNPFKVIRYETAHAVHVYLTEKDFIEACHQTVQEAWRNSLFIIFKTEWYDAPYRKNESNNMPSETYKELFDNPK